MKTATLSICYNNLDMGIILVDTNLEIFFMNTWMVRKMPCSARNIWNSKNMLNLETLLAQDEHPKIKKIATLVRKTIHSKSVQVISQAFHEWLIPLNDPRFRDCRMRQSCILQPYSYHRPSENISEKNQIAGDSLNFSEEVMALIQIRDDSDTVLRAENLKKSRQKIHTKNLELIKANCELAETNHKLHQQEAYLSQVAKMEALGRMTGGIAHNFNNYLAVILGNTEMLMDDFTSTDSLYLLLENIKTTSMTARDMISQLLRFSHPDLESQKKTCLNLEKIIPEMMPLLKTIVPPNIDIGFQMEDHSPFKIRANDSQIHEILLNLIKNAAHAIDDSNFSFGMQTEYNIEKNPFQSQTKGCIKIILGHKTIKNKNNNRKKRHSPAFLPVRFQDITSSGAYITLTVEDNGHGIAPEHIDKLFDPYFTTRDVGQGAGIGLSVVHGIVTHLKGVIRVETKINKGSAFIIFFPEAADIKAGSRTNDTNGFDRSEQETVL